MFIAVDIGGTTTRVGASRDGKKFVGKRRRFRTPRLFEDGIAKIVEAAKKCAGGGRLDCAVVDIPGTTDQEGCVGGVIPNLSKWAGKPLKAALENAFGCSVRILNDAAAAALGEAVRGAGRYARSVAYLTVSTGIGGARVVGGKLDATFPRGFEPGHHILVQGGKLCGCGQRGCFEAYASGTAFEKTFGVRAEQCHNSRIWDRYAHMLAQGVHNIIVLWSPDVLVIGGGVSHAGNRLFVPLRRAIRGHTFFKCPPIRRAKLGDNSGLYGCLEALRAERS